MLTLKQITQTLAEDQSLKTIAQAYAEVAATRLSRIKLTGERNQAFLQEVENLYSTLKDIARRKNVKSQALSKGTVHILLTSNYRLYGKAEVNLIKLFAANIKEQEADYLVVGKTGASFAKVITTRKIDTLILTDDLPSGAELKELAARVGDYQKILVYYPRFRSVLVQEPTAVDIASPISSTSPRLAEASGEGGPDFILEPEIGQMLDFFDTQIVAVLLEQAFLEAELARTASRVIAMTQAQDAADEFIAEDKKILARLKNSKFNNQLSEMVSSLLAAKDEARHT